jgi:hypothetical protein
MKHVNGQTAESPPLGSDDVALLEKGKGKGKLEVVLARAHSRVYAVSVIVRTEPVTQGASAADILFLEQSPVQAGIEEFQLLSMQLHRIIFSPKPEILFGNASAEIKTDLTMHDRPTKHICTI